VVVGDDVVVRATPVDRGDQWWENDGPAYRVYFWTGESRCDEWELTEADVDEVLACADAQAGGRTMSVWVVHRDDDGVGLIRFGGCGSDGRARGLAELGRAATSLRCLRLVRCSFRSGLCEPIAGGAGLDDLSGEGEAVDDGGAEPRVDKGLRPTGERLVTGDRDG
jgi:hypothetical protein